jgi:hypothetical protein
VIVFAPVDRDLPQCLRAVCEPVSLDPVPMDHVSEVPARAWTVDCVQQITLNPVRRH